jgi:DNA-binding response OmpR family regulator
MERPVLAAFVLVVDSDAHNRAGLCDALEGAGYSTACVGSARTALGLIAGGHFDIVLSEDALQDMSGVDMLRELRASSSIPAIVIAGQASSATRVAAFAAGADDCIEKPVAPAELVRRVHAVLRRSRNDESMALPTSGAGTISLDLETREARIDAQTVRLTARQFGVLRMLLARRGSVVSADDLADTVWGYPTYGQPNFVEKQLSGVRKALRTLGAYSVIENVRCIGWIIR